MALYSTEQPFSPAVSRYYFNSLHGLVASNVDDVFHYPDTRNYYAAAHGRNLLPGRGFPSRLYFSTSRDWNYRLRANWGRDNYFYMAYLPCSLDCRGDPLLDPLDWRHPWTPALLAQWQELEHILLATARALIPLRQWIPLDTRMPPLPSNSGYAQCFSHPNDPLNSARRLNAQRFLLAWCCWISFVISLGLANVDGLPRWKKLLQASSLEPTVIDRITQSSFLCGLTKEQRVGMVFNMSADWGIFNLCERMEPSIRIWYLFPTASAADTPSSFGRSLLPKPHFLRSLPLKEKPLVTQPPLFGSTSQRLPVASTSQCLPVASKSHHQPSESSVPLPPSTSSLTLTSPPPSVSGPSRSDASLPHTDRSMSTPAHSSHRDHQALDDEGMPFPPNSAQGRFETMTDFFIRRRLDDEIKLSKESAAHRALRMQRIETFGSMTKPYQKLHYFQWVKAEHFPYHFRQPRTIDWAEEVWEDYTLHQKRFHAWSMDIDFSEDFAPDEEPFDFYAGPNQEFMQVPSWEDNNLPNVQHPTLPVLQPVVGEFKKCFMTIDNMEPLTTALKTRYGATLTPFVGPPSFSFDMALRHLNEEHHGLLSSQEAHGITHFVSSVLAARNTSMLPVEVSDLSIHSPRPPTLVSLTEACPASDPDKRIYVLSCRNSKELGLYLLAYDSITARQICRIGTADLSPLAENLICRGCTFGVLSVDTQATPQLAHTPRVTTSFRARTHTFTRDDYCSYVLSRSRLLLKPALAVAAFTHGGIIWRLASESVQQRGVMDLSSTELPTHNAALINTVDLPQMVTYSLSPSEIEMIVGAYTDYNDRQKQLTTYTWWPTPTIWNSSGLNVGYWTRGCEVWFQDILQKIREGKHYPLSQSQWRKILRRHTKTVRDFQDCLLN
ncbi:hypothetical protein QCA50_012644 [Cerrena zonata]|uniref:Uncharacterized protein n=1 Tax=Cerrena zonata TaxID=2478898 RepID=A0AAW0FZN9_9APHY